MCRERSYRHRSSVFIYLCDSLRYYRCFLFAWPQCQPFTPIPRTVGRIAIQLVDPVPHFSRNLLLSHKSEYVAKINDCLNSDLHYTCATMLLLLIQLLSFANLLIFNRANHCCGNFNWKKLYAFIDYHPVLGYFKAGAEHHMYIIAIHLLQSMLSVSSLAFSSVANVGWAPQSGIGGWSERFSGSSSVTAQE